MFTWDWRLSELPTPGKDAPKVFSTFACGGGSSMGYKRAGFNVLGCCEIDPKINAVYKRNLHPRFNYVMDLRDFNKLEDLPEELLNLDVLDGSPPCSTFSMAGDREKAWGKQKKFAEGQKLQRLDDLFFTFLETVEKLRPKIVVAENVDGMTRGNAKGYVSEIIDRFHELGYQVQLFRINAMYADVPQSRVRIFFIANRMGYPKLKLDFKGKPIKFGEVRSEHGSSNLSDHQKRLLQNRKPNDKTLADINIRLRGKNSQFGHLIVHDEDICGTITSAGEAFRMCDGKKFSDHDLKAVSTFPNDYDNAGCGLKFLVGMSVPVNLMANVAYQIRKQWLDQENITNGCNQKS